MTEEQRKIKKYSNYRYNDFINDDFFIKSHNAPTKESIDFWEQFRKHSQSNRKEYDEAILTLKVIREDAKSLSKPEIDSLWHSIDKSILSNKKKSKRIYLLASIAASLIIILLSAPKIFFLDKDTLDANISAFAKQTKFDYNIHSNTQLILSPQKEIELSTKESEIRYDSLGIQANEQEILKDEGYKYNQLIVPRGKRSQIKLIDGTHLFVNSGTRVVYPVNFDSDVREIYVDGEIYIDVVSDGRPFLVKTDKMTIEVLGTTFNVMSYENEDIRRVTLVGGKIKISDSLNKSTIVSPSMMYELREDSSTLKEVDTQIFTSWIDGVYRYQSDKLEDIIAQLGRYYGTQIVYENDVANFICSGKINLDSSLDKILEDIAYVLPIEIEKQNDMFYIKNKKY